MVERTYAEIKAEIAALEREAQSAFEAEVAGVIGRIKEAIAFYNLTAEDLGFQIGTKPPRAAAGNGKKKPVRVAASGVAKYRDPETGKTWTGRGKPPNWIAKAASRDDYLIEKAPTELGAAA